MTRCWRFLLAALLALAGLPSAQAAISCMITPPSVALFYNANTTASVQTSFDVTCTRPVGDPATSVTYTVGADNGNNSNSPPQNRARAYWWIFPVYLRYDLYTNSACSTAWDSPRTLGGTISWPTGQSGSITKTTTFWACIPSQNVILAGTYTDAVTLTLAYNGVNKTADAQVSITTPASCTFTSPPQNITLAYAAFGPQASGTSKFSVQCTLGMPYTIAADPDGGVLSGVRYTLATTAASGSGTGNPQEYTITATAPGGQAGQCGTGTCTGTNTHTLTISY